MHLMELYEKLIAAITKKSNTAAINKSRDVDSYWQIKCVSYVL